MSLAAVNSGCFERSSTFAMGFGECGGNAMPRRRVQLVAVKEDIFNPRLPTIRHMDRDTSMHRLPDEHCRTSTTLGPDDFKRSTTTLLQQPTLRLHSLAISDQGKRLLEEGLPSSKYTYKSVDLERTAKDWDVFLNRTTGDRPSTDRPNALKPFSGYAVRYSRPEVTASWRYTLRQEPTLDQYGQRPVPANIFSRYRDSHPQYGRSAATEAWR